MTLEGLYEQILKKQSFLCVGLDTDILKIPSHQKRNTPDLKSSASGKSGSTPILDFNRAIIDATHDLAIAYKPNLAFYESRGAAGWEDLARTVEYIRSADPDIFLIADAKRGDIGNTASMYAKTFFEELDFDAVTISPYMGQDSVQPFLEYEGKWVIVLGLTSNPGAEDFQFLSLQENGRLLYEEVIFKAAGWAGPDRIMFVAGATRPELITGIRQIIPDHFLLVPGVGAQGGSLEEVAKAGMNKHCGLIVNSSRSILYAEDSPAFAAKARENARNLQLEMSSLLVR
jgi:orotidine-5'-phosphate decarboxylase